MILKPKQELLCDILIVNKSFYTCWNACPCNILLSKTITHVKETGVKSKEMRKLISINVDEITHALSDCCLYWTNNIMI